jgi:hypothetical protein
VFFKENYADFQHEKNVTVSFGGGGATFNQAIFSAEFLGQLSTSDKFRPWLILTRQILTT